ncbi:MAG: methylmalonyl Co-A mutase-associated GTPase MeaB [Myxococcota bacterium]
MRRSLNNSEILRGLRAGNRAILGRAISLVESHRAEHMQQAQELLVSILPHTGRSFRVGISGVPGVGKSTLIEALGMLLIERGHRVAVLAIDPSSRLTRGSILGDKTRMQQLSKRSEAFIRPSPNGGCFGGVGRQTREAILLCEAAGYDIVLVETVGVGQAETRVAEMVDSFLVLLLAGAGDQLQGIKKGILEVADVLAINKADGEQVTVAQQAAHEYKTALTLLRAPSAWSTRVLTCSGLRRESIEALWSVVCAHRDFMQEHGLLAPKREHQQIQWMWQMSEQHLLGMFRKHSQIVQMGAEFERQIREQRQTSTFAAQRLVNRFLSQPLGRE